MVGFSINKEEMGMLVLSRKQHEVLVINGGTPDEIRITVTAVHGGRVGIGIEAPKHIKVNRLEVHNKALEQSNGKSDVAA